MGESGYADLSLLWTLPGYWEGVGSHTVGDVQKKGAQ